MLDGLRLEREALRRLPALLAELLDEREADVRLHRPADDPVDAIVDARDRRWLIEVKGSSRPAIVDRAANQARHLVEARGGDLIPLLVVPYMTEAGARAADVRELDWVDLSGNASIRAEGLYVHVQGRPNQFASPGRPSSPFAPKSARVARTLLLDPEKWWRQRDLAIATDLDDGRISRITRRLDDGDLLERDGSRFRPRDPSLMLDEWGEVYRFDRHDVIAGHMSGSGVELARALSERLSRRRIRHAFTGLPAAWVLDPFAGFRLSSVYVVGDPRDAADAVELRRNDTGANVQLIGPDDRGVFAGRRCIGNLTCVAPVQVYLDLLHLPERARDAAAHLRSGGLWRAWA